MGKYSEIMQYIEELAEDGLGDHLIAEMVNDRYSISMTEANVREIVRDMNLVYNDDYPMSDPDEEREMS